MAETERRKEISLVIEGARQREQALEIRVQELRIENGSAPEGSPTEIQTLEFQESNTLTVQEFVLRSQPILDQNKPKGNPDDSKTWKQTTDKRKIDKKR